MNKTITLLLFGGVAAAVYIIAYYFNMIPVQVTNLVAQTRPLLSGVQPYITTATSYLTNPAVLATAIPGLVGVVFLYLRNRGLKEIEKTKNDAIMNLQSSNIGLLGENRQLDIQNKDLLTENEGFKTLQTQASTFQDTIKNLKRQLQTTQTEKTELERLLAHQHIVEKTIVK